MDHPQRLERNPRSFVCAAGAVVAALLLGCGTVGGVKRMLREPGEHFKSFPEEVWEEYECAQKELPFFEIEEMELVPNQLEAGEEFNHRLVYVLCPDEPTGVVPGTLHTRIYFRGRPIVRQLDPKYELKPGRWVVDSFVTIPAEAETGIYSMQLEFDGDPLRFERKLSFAVEAREP